MKKIILLTLSSFLLMALLVSCGSKPNQENTTSGSSVSKGDAPDKKYIKLVEKENERLPTFFPNGMRLDKVEALSKKEFRYLYTFTKKPEVGKEEFERNFKLPMSLSLQEMNDGIFKEFKKDSMTIIYTYMLVDGELFAEIKMTPEDYIKEK